MRTTILLSLLCATASMTAQEDAAPSFVPTEEISLECDKALYATGDTIRYETTVIGKEQDRSQIVYVDLMSPEGLFIARHRHRIDSLGNAKGWFTIEQPRSGLFELRAYTEYLTAFYDTADSLEFTAITKRMTKEGVHATWNHAYVQQECPYIASRLVPICKMEDKPAAKQACEDAHLEHLRPTEVSLKAIDTARIAGLSKQQGLLMRGKLEVRQEMSDFSDVTAHIRVYTSAATLLDTTMQMPAVIKHICLPLPDFYGKAHADIEIRHNSPSVPMEESHIRFFYEDDNLAFPKPRQFSAAEWDLQQKLGEDAEYVTVTYDAEEFWFHRWIEVEFCCLHFFLDRFAGMHQFQAYDEDQSCYAIDGDSIMIPSGLSWNDIRWQGRDWSDFKRFEFQVPLHDRSRYVLPTKRMGKPGRVNLITNDDAEHPKWSWFPVFTVLLYGLTPE